MVGALFCAYALCLGLKGRSPRPPSRVARSLGGTLCKMANPPFYIFGLPDDPAVLQALGVVAIRQGHLDRMLRMTYKILAELPVRQALDETLRENSSALRKRIHRVATQRLGEGAALVKLQALLDRAKSVTDRRNELMHGVCGREIDETDSQILNEDHSIKPFPTVDELNELAIELKTVTNEFNNARIDGFIRIAMDEKKPLARD